MWSSHDATAAARRQTRGQLLHELRNLSPVSSPIRRDESRAQTGVLPPVMLVNPKPFKKSLKPDIDMACANPSARNAWRAQPRIPCMAAS